MRFAHWFSIRIRMENFDSAFGYAQDDADEGNAIRSVPLIFLPLNT